MKKIFGFSLVEIVVALIIVSVIIALLAPIITRRIKSNSVSIGQVTNTTPSDNITSECSDNPNFGPECKLCTSKYCIDCGLKGCAIGQYADIKRCECKNCSEKYGNACSQCDSKNCIQCISSSYYINNGVCTLCPSGSYCDGKNILPTCPEGHYCNSSGIHSCSEKFSAACKECTESGCKKCDNYYFLTNGKCKPCEMHACVSCTSTSYCTKCNDDFVVDPDVHQCITPCGSYMEGCVRCYNQYACKSCNGGYYLNSSSTCSACNIQNCVKCIDNRPASNPTCSICFSGYYLSSSNSCKSCTSKFGANCSTCNANECLSCSSGYHIKDSLANPACEKDDEEFHCSDSNFMQFGNACITKRNMGDSATLIIPPSVTIVKAGSDEICNSQSQKCCWSGPTANQSSCDSTNANYSGCKRTVCNLSAAKEICANFKYAGKNWRLPTNEELKALPYIYSIGLGTNGLMLCDAAGGYLSPQCGFDNNRCKGAIENNCYPYGVWSGDTIDYKGYGASLYRGSWTDAEAGSAAMAIGVRCVTDEMD